MPTVNELEEPDMFNSFTNSDKMMTPRKLSWTIQKRFKMLKVLSLNLSNSLIYFRKAIVDQDPLLQVLIRQLIKVSNISLDSKRALKS